MTVQRVEVNRKAMARLLKEESVPLLEDITRDIAAAAGPGFEGDVQIGANRARGLVGTTDYESRKAEAEDRVLTRSIDAGRR